MDYWFKQVADKPLFEDILWSRPENKRSAGKLLIIGGQANSFADTVRCYEVSIGAGIGTVRVLLPDSLQKSLGTHLEYVWFAPSSNAGGFGKASLDSWIEHAKWSDGVLIVGDIGKNSETAIVLESFLDKFSGQVNLLGHSAILIEGKSITRRPDTIVSVSLAQLQKFLIGARSMHAVYRGMQLNQFVEAVHLFTGRFEVAILSSHEDNLVCAYDGKVTTQPEHLGEMWQLDTAAAASVFWLQNPTRTFESITSSLLS